MEMNKSKEIVSIEEQKVGEFDKNSKRNIRKTISLFFQKKIVQFVSLFLIISLIVLSVHNYNDTFYVSKSNYLIQKMEVKDTIMYLAIQDACSKMPAFKRVENEFYLLDKTKKPYIDVARTYNIHGYVLTITFTIITVLTGILLFLIGVNGWTNTKSMWLKYSFIICFFYSTCLGLVIKILNHVENSKNNIEQYDFISGLQLELFSFVQLNENNNDTNSINAKVDTLLVKVNNELQKSPMIFVDIKMEEIPNYNTIRNDLGKNTGQTN
jgi:hypothetical protein